MSDLRHHRSKGQPTRGAVWPLVEILNVYFFYKREEIDRVSGTLREPQPKQWIIQNVNKIQA